VAAVTGGLMMRPVDLVVDFQLPLAEGLEMLVLLAAFVALAVLAEDDRGKKRLKELLSF
jgi:hypothetical protein